MSEFIESLLSGEKIQKLCDVYCGIDDEYDRNPTFSPEKDKHLNLHNLNTKWDNPPRIFCYGQALGVFMNKLQFLQNPFLLVSHNSDTNITETFLPLLEHPCLVRWFGQNAMITHTKLHFLPIGIGNSMWPHGNVHNFEYAKLTETDKEDRIYFYFNIETNKAERSVCKSKLEAKGLVFGTHQPHLAYLQSLARCKYAICPPGYGIDCHRIWECFLLNVIPIVIRSKFSETIGKYMPCVILDDWDDFDPILMEQYDAAKTKLKPYYMDFRYYKNLIELVSRCIFPTTTIIDRSVHYSHEDNKKIPLDKKLDNVFQKSNGFFIELGANNGLEQSNTAYFEFYKEWNGILIEPSHVAFQECKKHRQNSICFNCACVSDAHTEPIVFGDFFGSLMSSIDGERLNSSSLISVPSRTLESILDEVGVVTEIDFLSLDVEGYELPIIKGLNLQKYRPTYILIEIYTKDFQEIMQFMSTNDYVYLCNLSNYNIEDNKGWDGQHNDYLFVKGSKLRTYS